MNKIKTFITVLLATVFISGVSASTAYAGDGLEHELPEVLTGMDENGNVYELDTASGYVEVAMLRTRSNGTQVVNFNTKGAVVTEYKEVKTGTSGYTCGTYGADAAYLGTYGTKVRFMLSGVIGEVSASEVQVIEVANAKSISHYMVSDGRLYHKVSTNLNSTNYGSTLEQGKAPDYMTSGTKYYSYDGHFFYEDYALMLNDYRSDTRAHSINADKPYYNYFQYLPLRSQTNYTGSKLNEIINKRVSLSSKMYNLGTTFVDSQNTYGVNALLAAGVAANESAWGTSNIAKNKNNLFGLNAVDSDPTNSSNYYSDVKKCVQDFTETYMSKQYLNPGNWKYFGGFLGNKASGINVKYASDPYWGEKAANVAWVIDKSNGNKDDNAYTIGIKDVYGYEHTALNIRKESNTSSTIVYKTGKQVTQSFLVMGEENSFYKIQSDGVLVAGRDKVDSSTGDYNYEDMYLFAHKDYVTKVSSGAKVSVNTWKIKGILSNLPSPQLMKGEITLSADMSNADSNLEYKFVWMKDDWNAWGVIRDFEASDSVIWIPEEAGEYTIYMDVQDTSGRIESVTIDYKIKNWGIEGIEVHPFSPQGVGCFITISPNMVGNVEGIKYKFVWMKDDWDAWGVIQEMSVKDTATWIPKETGEYTLYVDVEDPDGLKLSRIISYTIEELKLEAVNLDKLAPVMSGEQVLITATANYNNPNLQYKFVWMKDDWDAWGVIQAFSDKNSTIWTPEEEGMYELYVDVTDGKKTVSKYITCEVIKASWEFTGVATVPERIQKPNNSVQISAKVSGFTSDLQYKFVWEKDGWNEWGVIREFSSINQVTWKPRKSGQYSIYVDVKDKSGETITQIIPYEIGNWNLDRIQFSVSSPQEIGTDIKIKPIIYGNAEAFNLEYKFVWEKDGWSEWGILQEYSSQSACTWTPTEKGNYSIYVDVREKGKTEYQSQFASYKVTAGIWKITGVSFDQASPQVAGTPIQISPKISGNSTGLEYKFVWMKDNWNKWGVIQQQSSSSTATWVPEEVGTYKIYVDVCDKAGKIASCIQEYTIESWGIVVSPEQGASVGKTVTISLIGMDGTENFQYKFVWEKDDWNEWGVLQGFSNDYDCKWTPEKAGTYRLYVDVKNMSTGKTTTKEISYKIN